MRILISEVILYQPLRATMGLQLGVSVISLSLQHSIGKMHFFVLLCHMSELKLKVPYRAEAPWRRGTPLLSACDAFEAIAID